MRLLPSGRVRSLMSGWVLGVPLWRSLQRTLRFGLLRKRGVPRGSPQSVKNIGLCSSFFFVRCCLLERESCCCFGSRSVEVWLVGCVCWCFVSYLFFWRGFCWFWVSSTASISMGSRKNGFLHCVSCGAQCADKGRRSYFDFDFWNVGLDGITITHMASFRSTLKMFVRHKEESVRAWVQWSERTHVLGHIGRRGLSSFVICLFCFFFFLDMSLATPLFRSQWFWSDWFAPCRIGGHLREFRTSFFVRGKVINHSTLCFASFPCILEQHCCLVGSFVATHWSSMHQSCCEEAC